ncbi:MAG TPA: cysteine--tRNA ligase [Candidatus Brocadiia bacterium]|nr:cysteine--tRNA ligase [Planctomycetota bacterium]MDO8093134.1 cysteine--tRNA ligase [Candidatus Brocadiales bacterium]
MTLRIYNTLTRRKDEFVPLHNKNVGIYVCGPTVYDHAHLGHAKSYVSFDVVVRYLRYLDYKVRYVQNITDVGHLTDNADQGEDKILKRAQMERVEPMELVEKYVRSYFEDMDAMGVIRPDISPRATGHIPEQIELVKTLVEKGYAYEVAGSVYFDVHKFEGYGKLSGRKLEELEAGARIEVNPEKRHPADFALWKHALPGHLMRWKSLWGEGFPGWHLECSAMSMRYLGETLDIHGGGLDNVFPHHECEVAQSEAANGKQFVRHWMHNNMVTVNGQKMSKSLGNFVTLKDAFKKYSPLTIRFFILSTRYNSPLDYSDDALGAANKGIERLHNTVLNVLEKLKDAPSGEADIFKEKIDEYKALFLEAMDDDFNTPGAIAALFDFSREVNTLLSAGQRVSRETLEDINSFYSQFGGEILGIVPESFDFKMAGRSDIEDALISLLSETRNKLRAAKHWQLSDDIRSELTKLGIILEDKPEGTTWKKG